jgi:hypothetical protein
VLAGRKTRLGQLYRGPVCGAVSVQRRDSVDVVNRGVAAWNGKVYLATIDGRLIALDAATGRVVWDVLTIEKGQPYAITGAPRVARGKVLIGQDERIAGLNSAAAQLFGDGLTGRHYIMAIRQPALLDVIEATLRRYATTMREFSRHRGDDPGAEADGR